MAKAKFLSSTWLIGVACFVLGVLVILGIRFVTYKPNQIHYHANFALYINGQRELFKGRQYYEEDATMCAKDTSVTTPLQRAHMHDNVNDVVHVEDHAVTWGQFFANLGWYMGPNFIQSPNGTMYLENGNNKLNLTLNNQDYTDLGGLANTVIKDKDKLLVSFGNESEAVLQQEYKAIPSSAAHYDTTPDPKTCSGSQGATLSQRLHHLF